MTDLVQLLRAGGIACQDHRVQGYDSVDFRAVLLHHTAGPTRGDFPSLGTLTGGRPDLRPPLANLGLSRGGAWVGVSDGRARHAGPGSAQAWARLLAGRTPERPTTPDDDEVHGNRHLLGVEWENPGVPGHPIGSACYDNLVAGLAILCEHWSWNPLHRILGHREWTRRKPDPEPANLTMATVRLDVALTLTGDDMTNDELRQIITEVVDANVVARLQGMDKREGERTQRLLDRVATLETRLLDKLDKLN